MLGTMQMIGRFLNTVAIRCGRFHVNYIGIGLRNNECIIQADCVVYDGIDSDQAKI